MTSRYALYFAPAADSPWERFGKHWLGRSAISGARLDLQPVPGLASERLVHLTARPRRYGFHATLKAPFRLAGAASRDELMDALEDFCRDLAPFSLPRLHPEPDARGFIGLVPTKEDSRLRTIAAECTTRFDQFRAPMDQEEFARRLGEALTPRQVANLERWGYPFVLEEFRFHFSLTDRLERSDAALAARLKDAIVARMPPDPLVFDAVSVFHEPCPGADFRLLRRVPLSARARRTFVPAARAGASRVAWVATWMPRLPIA